MMILLLGIQSRCEKQSSIRLKTLTFIDNLVCHENKYLKAISIWTLSGLPIACHKVFIIKLLNLLEHNDYIVKRSALSALDLIARKENIKPYLSGILSALAIQIHKFPDHLIPYLYSIIIALSKKFPNKFEEMQIVQPIMQSLLQRFHSNSISEMNSIIPILIQMTRSSYIIIHQLKIDLITKSFEILDLHLKDYFYLNENLDHLLMCIILELIIVFIEKLPHFSKLILSSHSTVPFLLSILYVVKEKPSSHYTIALLCHLISLDQKEIEIHFEKICMSLVNFLYYPEISIKDVDNLAIGVNSSWGLSLLVMKYDKIIYPYVDSIAQTSIAIISKDSVNKTFAQNLSILLGRLCLKFPGRMSVYIEAFIKQFCISMRFTDDSLEKQEAFDGVCHSLVHNPSGIFYHLGFFIDAICFYDNAPQTLKEKFQLFFKRISKNSKWTTSFRCLPDRLIKELHLKFRDLAYIK